MNICRQALRIFLLGAMFWAVTPSGAVAVAPIPATLGATLSPAALFVDEEADTEAAADEVRYSSRDLRVQVWHDKDDDAVYERGEELQLFFRTNEDAYVVLYYIDADGYTEVLWPTSRYDDGFVFGGHTYSIPGRGSEDGMWVSQSRGVEYAEAIASKYPFDLRELALDFRFDPEETGEYAHRVSGDPFLAVNDINYAITGLEEDVDWIVTDWTHIYVDQKVDYPRYTCTQCHDSGEDQEQYEPYAQTCTRVEIYSDWGWYSSWYLRFGYYPLYCDAPYYYWDPWYSRPYYFTYYPVCYTWPSYPVYVRPYPLYPWSSSGAYRGDYITLYERGEVHDSPLYDLSRAREISKGRDRGVSRSATPPSIATRPSTRGNNGRVRSDQLTRNPMPARSRDSGDVLAARGTGSSSRGGVRTDRGRAGRTVRSLHPARSDSGGERGSVDRGDVRGGRGSADRGGARGESGSVDRGGAGGGRDLHPQRPSRGGASPDESHSHHGRRWTRPIVRNAPGGAEKPSRSDGGRTVQPHGKRSSDHQGGGEHSRPKNSRPSKGKREVRGHGGGKAPSKGGSHSSGHVAPAHRSAPSRGSGHATPRRSSGGSHGSSHVAPRSPSGGSRGSSHAAPPRRSSGGGRGVSARRSSASRSMARAHGGGALPTQGVPSRGGRHR